MRLRIIEEHAKRHIPTAALEPKNDGMLLNEYPSCGDSALIGPMSAWGIFIKPWF